MRLSPAEASWCMALAGSVRHGLVFDFIVQFSTLIAGNNCAATAQHLLDCDALCEVTRLIHISATRTGGVIRQQLQRHDVQDRRERTVVFRHADHVHARFALDVCIGVREYVAVSYTHLTLPTN